MFPDVSEYIHAHHLFGTLLSALIWTVINLSLTDVVVRRILPDFSYKKLMVFRKTDADLDKMSRINATALIHASVSVPLALYCAHLCPGIRADPVNGQSLAFELLGVVMGGYFLWDTVVCLTNLRLYGTTFMIHALISFFGVYFQTASKADRIPYYVAAFMATEISTPFLHIRWFLMKSGDTNTSWFKFFNAAFISLFVGYRLVLLPIYGFVPFFKLIYFRQFTYMSALNQNLLVSLVITWTILNYYWGFALLRSQLRQLMRKSSKPLTTPLQDKKE